MKLAIHNYNSQKHNKKNHTHKYRNNNSLNELVLRLAPQLQVLKLVMSPNFGDLMGVPDLVNAVSSMFWLCFAGLESFVQKKNHTKLKMLRICAMTEHTHTQTHKMK